MKQVAEKLAEKQNITKKLAGEIVDFVIAGLIEEIKAEEKVRVSGLGTFSKKERAARTARNPKSGESIPVAAKTVVTFKAAKDLKEAVA